MSVILHKLSFWLKIGTFNKFTFAVLMIWRKCIYFAVKHCLNMLKITIAADFHHKKVKTAAIIILLCGFAVSAENARRRL